MEPDFRWLAMHGLLKQYVKQQLVHQACIGFSLTEQEQQIEAKAFWGNLNITTEAQREDFRVSRGLSQDGIEWLIQRDALLTKASLSKYGHKVESIFLDRRKELNTVVYELARVDNESLAIELYLRVQEGEMDFASVARKYSMGPEKKTNGIIGPIPIDKAHPSLLSVLESTELKKTTKPFKVDKYWIFVRVLERNQAKLDAATRITLAKERLNEEIEQQAQRLVYEALLDQQV